MVTPTIRVIVLRQNLISISRDGAFAFGIAPSHDQGQG
jgi:hypothetical protein